MKKNNLDKLELAVLDDEMLNKIIALENEINLKNSTSNIVLIGLLK